MRAADCKALARHRALSWHVARIASVEGPLALAPDVTIAVQLGDAEVAAREPVAGGRLQVLFMADSPSDVGPVLDYEWEEERILTELAPFVEDRRLVLKVVALHATRQGSLQIGWQCAGVPSQFRSAPRGTAPGIGEPRGGAEAAA